jgi:2-aminoethylphosphonate-pyruvate transaminase
VKQNQKIILLNPGPVTLTDRVRHALLHHDLCHREPEYARLQTDVRARLSRIYSDTEDGYAAILLTGSGTAAVEAMIGSLIPKHGRALAVANGVYGERIASILQTQGKKFDLIRSEWIEPINVEEVERRLENNGAFTHVITVHHETTTGRLNDLSTLGEICRRRNVALLVDAVSSFGGESIDFGGWNIEGCAATANKCLHSVPGISFVLVRKQALEERASGANSIYLDLFRNYEEQSSGYPLFTPAVQVVAALREALIELEETGGWEQRHSHYNLLSQKLRGELRQQGIRLLLGDENHYSAILSSFFLPEGIAFTDLYRELKESGYVIYAGQKSLSNAIFRVSVMGDLTPQDINDFTLALAGIIKRSANP